MEKHFYKERTFERFMEWNGMLVSYICLKVLHNGTHNGILPAN